MTMQMYMYEVRNKDNQTFLNVLASFCSFDGVCVDVDVREIVIEYSSRRIHHSISHGWTYTHAISNTGYGQGYILEKYMYDIAFH